jgi:hypothetical protein
MLTKRKIDPDNLVVSWRPGKYTRFEELQRLAAE